jgi:hypothetical protein
MEIVIKKVNRKKNSYYERNEEVRLENEIAI